MVPPQIRNIIFDLGAVLFDIDFTLTQNAFEKFRITDVESFYSKARQHEVFDQIETGHASGEQFYDAVRKISGMSLSDDQILSAWNAMLIGMTEDKINLLRKLSGKYRLYLLSNTNILHLEAVKQMIDRQVGYGRFEACFQKLYFSNEIGLRKPHPEVFEFVLKDAELKAEETMFIDDSPQHVEGAAKTGIHAVHLKDGQQVADLFNL